MVITAVMNAHGDVVVEKSGSWEQSPEGMTGDGYVHNHYEKVGYAMEC